MLSVEALNNFGAKTQEGLARCLGQEEFYLRLVKSALDSVDFDKLSAALAEDDLDTAFEKAHALKGVLGNLALTPMFEVAQEMTELLRTRTKTDYTEYNEKLNAMRQELRSLYAE